MIFLKLMESFIRSFRIFYKGHSNTLAARFYPGKKGLDFGVGMVSYHSNKQYFSLYSVFSAFSSL